MGMLVCKYDAFNWQIAVCKEREKISDCHYSAKGVHNSSRFVESIFNYRNNRVFNFVSSRFVAQMPKNYKMSIPISSLYMLWESAFQPIRAFA